MNISFAGIRDLATFIANNLKFGVDEGSVVKVIGNQTVGPCVDNDRFHGIVETIERDNSFAVVRKTGYAVLNYTTKYHLGSVEYTAAHPIPRMEWLVANGQGGVRVVIHGVHNAVEYLVVDVDEEKQEVTIYLG